MKKVICVVEDEKAINDLVNQYLKKEGYEVRSYYTYEEASAHVSDDDVHLWILDIMLDDKSGFDLIEEIRLQGKDIPVIFMSARDKEFDRIIGLEKGSDDYITKPFSPKELVLRVNNVIKRVYKNDSNRIMVDGYELDEESKNTVKELISSLKSEVEQLITPYLANMYCKSVEGVNTFRNHNTKMQNMLEELGFTNYAMQVKRRKEEELSNIDEIRSRQELRADCEKYLEESQITRYVTYVNVCLYLKSGKELQARVKKYGVALGKDAQKIQENINDRVAALEKNHDRTMQDMSDIWDDLYEVKNADDVEMLIDNIASVLQKRNTRC